MKEALETAVSEATSQSELARRIAQLTSRPIRQGHVWKWIRAGRVPPDMAIPVERATGGRVTRHELRPDLYPLEPTASVGGMPEAEAAQATGCSPRLQPLPEPEATGQGAA